MLKNLLSADEMKLTTAQAVSKEMMDFQNKSTIKEKNLIEEIEEISKDYQEKIQKNRSLENPEYSEISDATNGRLFAELTDFAKYNASSGEWMIYDNGKWETTKAGAGKYLRGFAKALTMEARASTGTDSYYRKDKQEQTAYQRKIEAMTRAVWTDGIARVAKDYLTITDDDLDRNPDLLNVKNGTLNLITGKFSEHAPAQLISKQASVNYDPDATDAVWETFIQNITEGDTELAKYIQIKFGQVLSGRLQTEDFQVLLGEKTRNGKTSLVRAIYEVLGDYSATLDPAVIMRGKGRTGQEASPETAKLKGCRFIIVPEGGSQNGSGIMDSEKIKTWTGKEAKIPVRRLYHDSEDWEMTGHLFIICNSMPRMADNSIFKSDRCNTIPFNHHFSLEEADLNIKDYFRIQRVKSAILNWLLEGYKMGQEIGWKIKKPEAVMKAIRACRKIEEDTENWFNLIVEEDNYGEVSFREIKQRYKELHEAGRIAGNALHQKELYRIISEAGYTIKDDHHGGKRILGARLKQK